MEDKRNNLRKHINAAREWLQQADKSIERKEDVKGDLKIMLAKAELKNAEKHQNQSRFIKILSFVTAAVIAFGIIFFNKQPEVQPEIISTSPEMSASSNYNSQVKSDSVSTISEGNIGDSKKISESVEESTSTVDNSYDIPSEPQPAYPQTKYTETYNNNIEREYATAPKRYVNPEPLTEDYENVIVPRTQSEPVESKINVEAKAPNEDMQKLMQSAGQILRAE